MVTLAEQIAFKGCGVGSHRYAVIYRGREIGHVYKEYRFFGEIWFASGFTTARSSRQSAAEFLVTMVIERPRARKALQETSESTQSAGEISGVQGEGSRPTGGG